MTTPPPRKLFQLLLWLIGLGYTFDAIEEPSPVEVRRSSRTSALAIYQVDEYRPPPTPPQPGNLVDSYFYYFLTNHCWKILWFFWILGIGAWVFCAVWYSSNISIDSPINPIRHPVTFRLFIFALVFTGCFSCGIPVCFESQTLVHITMVILVGYLVVGLTAGHCVNKAQPFRCQKLQDKFPIYVKLTAGHRALANVYINDIPQYEIYHEKDFSTGIFHTYFANNDWKGVTSIATALTKRGEDMGTIIGKCNSNQICLNGKYWVLPNLVFEWTYTSPATGMVTHKKIASDEGKWYFGKAYRPLVSLRSENGTEVFRAQSSRILCTAGDGDEETIIVPLGLMLLAENEYSLG